MKSLKIVFAALLSLCWIGTSTAQDKVYLHVSQPTYVIGETVHSAIHLPPNIAEQDLCIYALLKGHSTGKTSAHFVNNASQKLVDDFFRIGYDWPSDVYQLSYYLMTAKGQWLNIAHQNLSIINDLDKNLPVSQNDASVDINTSNLDILRNVSSEMTSLPLASWNLADGATSVSIRDVGISGMQNSETVSSQSLSIPYGAKLLSKPFVKGQFFTKEGQTLPISLFAVFLNSRNEVAYGSARDEGKFLLKLPEIYDNQKLSVMPYPEIKEGFQIKYEIPELIGQKQTLSWDDGIKAYVKWSKMRKMLYAYLNQEETNITYKESKDLSKVQEPDITYIIDEYETFNNLGEFFNENLSAALKFRKNKKGTKAIIKNPKSRSDFSRFKGEPFFIVDHTITSDADAIYHIDWDLVDRVEIFSDARTIMKKFGPLASNGLVIIHSKAGKMELNKKTSEQVLRLNGYQEPLNIDYVQANEKLKLNPMVAWKVINSPKDLSITLPKDRSIFEIQVCQMKADGSLVQQKKYIDRRIK